MLKRMMVSLLVLLVCACTKDVHHYHEKEVGSAGTGIVAPVPAPRFDVGEVGNAAHGRKIGDKIYLVDLVAYGVEKGYDPAQERWEPLFEQSNRPLDPFIKTAQLIQERLENSLRPNKTMNDVFPWKAVSEKLAQIYIVDPVFGLSLIQVMEMYNWTFIDKDLSRLPLKGNIIDIPEGELVQIANRHGRTFTWSLPALRMMDTLNVVASVTHELIQTLIAPEAIDSKGEVKMAVQNASRVRELNALFYQPGTMARMKDRGLKAYVGPEELPYTERTREEAQGDHYLSNVNPRKLAILGLSPLSMSQFYTVVKPGLLGRGRDTGERTIVHGFEYIIRFRNGSEVRIDEGRPSLHVFKRHQVSPLIMLDEETQDLLKPNYEHFVQEQGEGKLLGQIENTNDTLVLRQKKDEGESYQLSFASYRDGVETKTYVKFVKSVEPLEMVYPLYLSGRDLENVKVSLQNSLDNLSYEIHPFLRVDPAELKTWKEIRAKFPDGSFLKDLDDEIPMDPEQEGKE